MFKDKVKVDHVSLQTAISIPGAFQTETTLSEKKIAGVKMWWTPSCLLIEAKGVQTIIPHANVKNCKIDPNQDEEQEPVQKGKKH